MRWTWFFIAVGATLIVGMFLSSTLFLGLFTSIYRGIIAPRTHGEAVMQVLDQHAVPYARIQISDSCPPMPQCGAIDLNDDTPYAAEIVVAGAQPEHGRLVCRHRRTECVLTLAARGLHSVPLPPLAQNQPWVEVLRRLTQVLDARLHAMRRFSTILSVTPPWYTE